MNLDLVITQLRTYAPLFDGCVAGSAAYDAALDQGAMTRPAAYVIPLDDEPEPNELLAGLVQVVRETIGVVVDLDNSADRRGQTAATLAVEDVRAAVFAALLNWQPVLGIYPRGLAYARGGLLRMDRGLLRWQFDFMAQRTFTSADGWQPPALPLTEITADVVPPSPTGTFDSNTRTLASLAIPLPQI